MVTCNAIVLHSRRYADTSRIVILYTEELGKVSVVARGARTPKSTLGGALEPLTVVRTSIYHKRNRELHTLGSADALCVWKHLTGSLEHLEAGLALCKTIVRTQPTEVAEPRLFGLLYSTLKELEEAHPDAAYRIGLSARIRLASYMGFGLHLYDTPADTVQVSLEDGHVTTNGGYRLSSAVYSLLAQAPYQTLIVPQPDRVEVEEFLSHYFAHHLGGYAQSKHSGA